MNKQESKILKKIEEAKNALRNGDLKVIDTLVESKNESIKYKFLEGETKAIFSIATWYRYKGDYYKAIELLEKSLKLNLKLKNQVLEGNIYSNLAANYDRLGERKLATTYYMKCLEIYQLQNDDMKKARALANIGQMFLTHNEFEKAEKYLLDSWSIFKKSKNKEGNWIILNSLGSYYFQNDNKEKGAFYYNKSIENAKEFSNPVGISFGYRALAKISKSKKKYREANAFIEKSLQIVEDKGLENIKMSLILMKAENFILLEEFIIAEELIQNNLKKIKQEEQKLNANNFLTKIYTEEKKFELALNHFTKATEIKEKLENLETKRFIESTEAKYQNKIKENEKEILRLQKTEMEQKALRAQLNPHFFFNSLNSVNKFILDNDAENASKYLANFSSLMRKTLENSEESLITIEDEVEYLEQYLKLEQLRLDFSFQFEININEDIEEDFIKIPTMMLQPYVENAIKHGINGVENGLIKVSFELKDDENIICIIEDNGKGRGGSSSNHKSMGTSILENRIKILKNQYDLDFSISIKDLKDKEKKPLGTKILLTIPSLDLA